jgi:hypothetical protein
MYALKVFLGALLFLALAAAGVVMYEQNTYAQFKNIPLAVIKQANKSSSVTTPLSPFQGHSIKIFNIGRFSGKEWQSIDNYTSHGYEIKAVVPREDKLGHIAYYSVILETKG